MKVFTAVWVSQRDNYNNDCESGEGGIETNNNFWQYCGFDGISKMTLIQSCDNGLRDTREGQRETGRCGWSWGWELEGLWLHQGQWNPMVPCVKQSVYHVAGSWKDLPMWMNPLERMLRWAFRDREVGGSCQLQSRAVEYLNGLWYV